MRSIIHSIFIGVFFVFNLSAQDYWKKDYSTIDSLARNQKASSIPQLAQKLTQHLDSTDEKYRAIYTWIAYNVAYDLAAYKNPKIRTADPLVVFKSRKAVCSGYSALFKKLCELNQLPCEIVSGSASTVSGIGKQYSQIPNHDWVAISIHNQWYLCDVTWAAGYVDFSKNAFRFEFKPLYFCCPPAYFAYNHFPKEEKWLLGASTTKENFDQSVYYFYPSIELNLQNLTPTIGTIKYKNNVAISFHFQTSKTIQRISIKGNGQKKSDEIPFVQNGDTVRFEYTPQKNNQTIIVYINNRSCLLYKITP